MGIETVISGISLLAGLGSTASGLKEAELKNTAAYQAKEAEAKAQADYNAQQAAAKESYNQTIERLNQQFEAGLAETDASGKPTDLGLAMKQIVSNFMETSTTALRQWAAERGVAGSTIEGQAVANAATKAQESAQAYKQTERSNLFAQKEALAGKAKTNYDLNMVTPTSDLNMAIGERKTADSQNTGYNIATDLAAFFNNINGLVKGTETPGTGTTTGKKDWMSNKEQNVFEQNLNQDAFDIAQEG